ncbi:sushi, von Willebrand factor type A, EGF and pentraxin domain-containing protein 1-like isoform X2 [Amblyomma americanum]
MQKRNQASKISISQTVAGIKGRGTRTRLALASDSCGALRGGSLGRAESMRPPLFLATAVVLCATSALCQEAKCTQPASLVFHERVQQGEEWQAEFPVGTTLTYRCGQGFTPKDTDTWNATCLKKENGSLYWDIGQHDCAPVSCGHPGDVDNGRLLDSVFVFPRRVRYECNKGYRLEGEANLYCQFDAQWNAPKPECHIVECGTLDDIPNGYVKFSGTAFGSKADYSCKRGFSLVGSATRTCGAYGRWTDEPPLCEPVDCGKVEGITHGTLFLKETTFGSKATFSCIAGFRLVGNATLSCDADGHWSGEYPHCEEIWCSEEMLAQFTEQGGSVVVDDKPISGRQRANTTVRFICPPSSDLVGFNSSTCQETGAWQFEPPACKRRCVVNPGLGSQVLRNTSYRSQTEQVETGIREYESDNTVFVKCIDGYHFKEKSLRNTSRTELPVRCRDGMWEPPEPWCTEISHGCSVKEFYEVAPPGLAINASTKYVRRNTTFWAYCYDQGYHTLVGNGSPVICLENDSWAIPPHMKCIEGCGNFDTWPGGPAVDRRKDSYGFGDSITLSCRNGTVLQPKIERIACTGDGWSEGVLPSCVPAEAALTEDHSSAIPAALAMT